MPKTADKRADARRIARVQKAHQEVSAPATTRRAPVSPRGVRPRGTLAMISDYPWATTIFVLLIVGMIALILHQQRLGPWAPPAPPAAAHCNVTTHTCDKAPTYTLDSHKVYTATIHTAKGDIVIQLDPISAKQNVNNFVFLAGQHFYDGQKVSRVERNGQTSPITGSSSNLDLMQTGVGGKNGGPGFAMPNEPPTLTYASGAVAMANGSQFFICTGDDSSAISGATFPIIGKVLSGLSVAQALNQGDIIQNVTIASSTPTPTAAPSPTAAPTATATPKK
ncbi:MAG: peptidylprolyl isomerase [Ktedonobacterales bacterium]